MKIAAVIAEYNPFTPGHAYHIAETKKATGADAVVAIMSGNFVQRGEPAIFDKQLRTRLALEGGADVVLELPAMFALQTAELFAMGGVKILNSLGCIDYLSFGSESDIPFLGKIAMLLADEPYSFKKELTRNLDDKQPFAEARANAITSYFNLSPEESELLAMPNSILAIEYIKKIIQLESSIEPVAIHRIGANYHNEDSTDYYSATSLRKALREGAFNPAKCDLPIKCAKLYMQQNKFASNEDFFTLIRYAILRMDEDELREVSGMTEGLENVFIKNQFAPTFDDMLEAVHSKRYTRTAIQRIMYNILLGITKTDIERAKKRDNALYARVLGFRQESSYVIKHMTERSRIPVITNVPAYKKMLEDTRIFDKDILASDIYKLCTDLPRGEARADFKQVPIIRGNDFPEFI